MLLDHQELHTITLTHIHVVELGMLLSAAMKSGCVNGSLIYVIDNVEWFCCLCEVTDVPYLIQSLSEGHS